MSAYYNEIEPFAAAWLRELIAAGHIAPGDVDTRSIVDVRPDDLREYTQCHFFAGIGVWSYALRLAGWPDDRPVWTGSCPCQPFSAAGKGGGFDDERHLWPSFFHLIRECRPAVVAGEQVASKDGLSWLDLVQADMEGESYAFGAIDTCSAGSGAPHIRQRLRFIGVDQLAHSSSGRSRAGLRGGGSPQYGRILSTDDGAVHALADDDDDGREAGREIRPVWPELDLEYGRSTSGVADPDINRFQGRSVKAVFGKRRRDEGHASGRGGASLVEPAGGAGPTNGFWRAADWLFCRDGKWRAVEPGTFPLVNGAAARVGRLRGYGNAVDAEATRHFIEAYLETTGDRHLRLNDIFA